MPPPILVWTAPGPQVGTMGPVQGLTSHDRIALACWMQRTDAHGYRRMIIENGAQNGPAEDGPYVLIYAPGRDWALWGLTRVGPTITVWNCGTGADCGHHTTMFAALCSLPPVLHSQATNVTPVATAATMARLQLVSRA